MKRYLLALVLVMGCTDLIGPEDPEWLESCVFTLSQEQPFTITSEELSRCSDIKFLVVNFCGFDNYPSEISGTVQHPPREPRPLSRPTAFDPWH